MSTGRLAVGAVLLAAGSGSRLGRRPKCLLELDGVPIIRRMLWALADAGVDERLVVLGHHADVIEPVLRGLPVTLVHNPHPEHGQVSSQRLGLAALLQKSGAVLVALADQPLLDTQDIAALIVAFQGRAQGTQVLFPQVQGQRGNPVIFSSQVREQILLASPHLGCRQWQDHNPAAVAPFVTDNRHYCIDIDTDEDRIEFEKSTGRRLCWPRTLMV